MSRSSPEIVLRVGRKLLHGVLKLRGIALHLALDAAHRLCEEILCLIKVLLVLRPLLLMCLLIQFSGLKLRYFPRHPARYGQSTPRQSC